MSPHLSRRAAAGVMAVAFIATIGACGGARVEGTSGRQIEQLPADFVGTELLGLPVNQEDMSGTVARSKDAFVDAIGLYGLRRDELLQATLQVSKFRENAPIRRSGFRTSLVNQIGGSKVQSFRMGKDTVFRTTGRKQTISVWFRDQYLFVLAVRETFEQPRTLLRAALAVDPQ